MVDGVEFYNDEVELSREVVREKKNTFLVDWLIKSGVVKDEFQANVVMVITTLIAFALSLLFFYIGANYSFSPEEVDPLTSQILNQPQQR